MFRRNSTVALLLLLTLIGCGAPYAPGALLRDAHTAVVVGLDCLELRALPLTRLPEVLVAFHMGNRCYNPVCFDLSELRVTARPRDGYSVELSAYDPRRELRRACLGGRTEVVERVVYVSRPAVSFSRATLCFDLSRLAPNGRQTVRCFDIDQ